MHKKKPNSNYRFLDEAGDTTFYGKGKINIVGFQGVSKSFILGMVKFNEPLENIRSSLIILQKQIENEIYFKDIPSIQKKIKKGGFFFHATDDIPEVRQIFFKFIKEIKCSFEAVVGRKIPELYERKHNGNEAEFYADLLSHLIKNKLTSTDELVFKIAERGKATKNKNLQIALEKAKIRFSHKNPDSETQTRVFFDVQNHYTEPLLNIADYFCWAVQRVFERGETRFYNYLIEKISLVIDLYDFHNYKDYKNYYSKNKLTGNNLLK